MKIGKIISVEYDKFRIRLFHTTRTSTITIDGKVYYFGNIGSYLKVVNSSGEFVLCEVVSIMDWIGQNNQVDTTFNLDSSREIIMKPIGTLKNDKFVMGVGIFPSLYSDVEIVTYDDLDKILSNRAMSNEYIEDKGIHRSINIGKSKNLIDYPIALDINRFFNIHTAVLGNSGSGKSNTIAHILHEVYRKVDNSAIGAKAIIFDANGEYPSAFSQATAKSDDVSFIHYKPNIDNDTEEYKRFVLPYYLMNLDEWLAFLMASERTQKPFWDRVLQETYKFYKILNNIHERAKFANYIKWKLCLMLQNISSRVDSDTSKMTAARGAIAKIRYVCTIALKSAPDDTIADLLSFIDECNELCEVKFGDNHGQLSDALNSFFYKSDNHNEKYDNGYTSFRLIDVNEAIEVDKIKLLPGEYYDYKYLQTAVEMVLIDEESRGNLHIRDFVSTLMSRLDYFLYNPECDFMRIGESVYKNETEYLTKTFNISSRENSRKDNQLITIDLSEVGTDVIELCTSIIGRMLFDYRKQQKGENRQKSPVHLILDEAHRYIRKDASYIMRENIFDKIAREGRKFSLYLLISSQRPSELSQTVLSQCGNYIVHRIQNEVDMKYIYAVLPYFSEDYITKIKQAVPGEALIFGNCVPMPLMVKVDEAIPAPNSKNCDIRREWFIKPSGNEADQDDSTF
jgi:hypothetical protein